MNMCLGGIPPEKIGGNKVKHCIECGCIIPNDHESDICEVCQDERDGTISDGVRGDTS